MNKNLAKLEGSLTTLINIHLRSSERAKDISNKIVHKAFTEELEDLLEMVIDMQGTEESKQPITVVLSNNNDEVNKLKKYIRELEDSCENMCEVERNLRKQILQLKDDNRMFQEVCNGLKEKLGSMEETHVIKNTTK